MKTLLVFLHGWGGSRESWASQLEYFRQHGYECVALDFPGLGGAPEPATAWNVSDYAEYVACRIREKADHRRVIVVGHSFGGRVAIVLSATHPNLVDGLVLANAAGISDKPPWWNALLASISKLLSHVSGGGPFGKRAVRLREWFRGVAGSPDYRTASPLMREVLKNVVRDDLRSFLPQITSPTLVLWGDNDRVTPIATAVALHNAIRESQIQIISGAGHVPHRTHADEWNTRVRSFLTSSHSCRSSVLADGRL